MPIPLRRRAFELLDVDPAKCSQYVSRLINANRLKPLHYPPNRRVKFRLANEGRAEFWLRFSDP